MKIKVPGDGPIFVNLRTGVICNTNADLHDIYESRVYKITKVDLELNTLNNDVIEVAIIKGQRHYLTITKGGFGGLVLDTPGKVEEFKEAYADPEKVMEAKVPWFSAKHIWVEAGQWVYFKRTQSITLRIYNPRVIIEDYSL